MALIRSGHWTSTLSFEAVTCLSCQWRSFSSLSRRLAIAEKPASPTSTRPPPTKELPVKQPSPTEPAAANPTQTPSVLDEAPRAYGKTVDKFDPQPLNRPIGLPHPPMPGENSGVEARSWKQRRDDFVNYDKHLARRQQLKQKMSTPYFREWSNMRHHKGKSFLSPPRLFKSDKALFFPNLCGQTLVKGSVFDDTTLVMANKISVVSMFSSTWAERQAASFVGEKNNQELHQIVKGSGGLAQMVRINVEENYLKAMLVRLFMPNLRRTITQEDWHRYFLVTQGLTGDLRDAIGLLNSKVGYVYLLDTSCRIRWAGSGIGEADEKAGLLRGIQRLVEEAKTTHVFKPVAV